MSNFIFTVFCFFSFQYAIYSQDSPDLIFEEAAMIFSDIEGIDLIEDQSGKLILEGTVFRKSDLQRVQDFIKKHPDIKNHTQLDAHLKALKPKISNAGTAFVEVALIEVKKTAFKRVGIRLSEAFGIEAGFSSGSYSRSRFGTADPVRAFLDLALQNGEAKIHSKQSLVAAEGKTGVFQVGGQFPIKTITGHISKIEFMDYGLILKFCANFIGDNKARLQIQSEISDIDMGSLVDGIPVMSKKQLKTEVVVKVDEMLALGGLVKSSESDHFEGIPGLSEVPVLGRLFRSEDFRQHRSEAYIFAHIKKMDQPWLPSPDL